MKASYCESCREEIVGAVFWFNGRKFHGGCVKVPDFKTRQDIMLEQMISKADQRRLLESELADAKRNAAAIGAAFRDVFNDVGHLPEVRERFESVYSLIKMYEQ